MLVLLVLLLLLVKGYDDGCYERRSWKEVVYL